MVFAKGHTSTTYNPFLGPKQDRSATIYEPDTYTLNTIISLSPPALRMLLIMARHINQETGIAECDTKTIRTYLTTLHRVNISKARTELLRAGLIAYAKGLHKFWMNPKAFKVINISM